jgi:hypothetical protein
MENLCSTTKMVSFRDCAKELKKKVDQIVVEDTFCIDNKNQRFKQSRQPRLCIEKSQSSSPVDPKSPSPSPISLPSTFAQFPQMKNLNSSNA